MEAPGRVVLDELTIEPEVLREVDKVFVVACGTSYHAAMMAKYAIERWARLPVEIDIASEFRYRDPVLDDRSLVIGISQSGETIDTLAAVRYAKAQGSVVIGVSNVVESAMARESDAVLYTRAGIEIGVAATKTFTAQVTLMYLLALRLAEVRRTLPPEQIASLLAEVSALPDKLATYLGGSHPIDEIALRHYQKPFFLYLGRHIGLPVCLEGALKLKEISYIPTEAYSAGEMKHGPIALLDDTTPVVCVATDSDVYDKVELPPR